MRGENKAGARQRWHSATIGEKTLPHFGHSQPCGGGSKEVKVIVGQAGHPAVPIKPPHCGHWFTVATFELPGSSTWARPLAWVAEAAGSSSCADLSSRPPRCRAHANTASGTCRPSHCAALPRWPGSWGCHRPWGQSLQGLDTWGTQFKLLSPLPRPEHHLREPPHCGQGKSGGSPATNGSHRNSAEHFRHQYSSAGRCGAEAEARSRLNSWSSGISGPPGQFRE